MKNFSDYANIAINRHGLRGVNALARELQIKSSSMSRLNTGKSLPAESTMIKLAELAGLPKEEALIDLNLWRSAKNPELQTIWTRIAKMIRCAILAAFLAVNPAQAKTIKNNHLDENVKNFELCNVNIMRQFLRKLILKVFRLCLPLKTRCCND